MNTNQKKRRSAIAIMGSLIGLVTPLIGIMLMAILLGTAGYLCAIFLTILATQVLLQGLTVSFPDLLVQMENSFFMTAPVKTLFITMGSIAVLRGLLHYAEQYCNHYIAFKLLAAIRHKIFLALRKLCPAKLEGKDKGNLISIITTDIELLEVFYAHTISPIAIATLTSIIMVVFIGRYSIAAGVLALIAYVIVGALIPMWNGKRSSGTGMEFRSGFGALNSFVLDSLRGLDETIQYGKGAQREQEMEDRSNGQSDLQEKLSVMEGGQRSVTNLAILLFSFAMLFLTVYQYGQGALGIDGVLTCTVAMMGSFGPVVALSSLSNNLAHTLASGERVLSILEEQPMVEEIPEEDGCDFNGKEHFTGAEVEHVNFAYGDEQILKDYSITIPAGKIVGIHGVSGSGKSTLLKLLMRFWDVDSGEIRICDKEIRTIATKDLRDAQSYVTQETHLFHDSIANNIAVGKPGATREEIMDAAKKASIHDFIMTLPEGYDTQVGELGDTLSGGEKQRIGIARAFLHDAPFILMDEPTSNLDSLNEGIILKSLKEEAETKTVVLVSHRQSTMNVADVVFEMANGRLS